MMPRYVEASPRTQTLEKPAVMAGLSLSLRCKTRQHTSCVTPGSKKLDGKSAVGIGHARRDRGSAKDNEPLNRGGSVL